HRQPGRIRSGLAGVPREPGTFPGICVARMSRLQPLMRMLVVLLAAVLLADAAWAWLPTTTELRRMWLRDRELSHPIHLSYRNPDQTDGFDVMIRPDGLWGKRIVRNREITRTVWKWG